MRDACLACRRCEEDNYWSGRQPVQFCQILSWPFIEQLVSPISSSSSLCTHVSGYVYLCILRKMKKYKLNYDECYPSKSCNLMEDPGGRGGGEFIPLGFFEFRGTSMVEENCFCGGGQV